MIRAFIALLRDWWAHRRSTMSRDWVRAQKQQAINKSAEVDGVNWNWNAMKEAGRNSRSGQ